MKARIATVGNYRQYQIRYGILRFHKLRGEWSFEPKPINLEQAEALFHRRLCFADPLHIEARDLLELRAEYLEARPHSHEFPSPDPYWTRDDFLAHLEEIEYREYL